MHAFDVLGDPVRRRLVELLVDNPDSTAGALTEAVRSEFGISQPAVSNHLRVLRENGFASSQRRGSHRWYTLQPDAFSDVQVWVERYSTFWTGRLGALDTEIRRGAGAPAAAPAARRDTTSTDGTPR